MPTALVIDAFDATPGPHVVLSLDGHIIALNRDAREHPASPWREAPRPGELMTEYVVAPSAFLSNLRRCSEGEHVSQDLEVPRPNGEIACRRVRYQPLQKDGAVRACLLSVRDLERPWQLARYAQRFRRLEAASLVAGGVVHDASNLLGIVSLHLPSILETTREVEQVTGAVTDAIDRLISLFGGLRRHLGDPPLSPRRVSLSDFLDGAASLVRMVAGRRIKVRIVADPELTVCIDEVELHRVLLSLVANSRDAMPDGGDIVISATSGKGPGSATSASQGDVALLCVRDTGTGISPAAQRDLFEPFFTTKGSRGTGLGLACSREAVRQFGGFLDVSSVDGQGTTVTIGLPKMAVPTYPGGALDAHTMLVIDGDDVTRPLWAADLSAAGAMVLEASTAGGGVAIAEKLASLDGVLVDDRVTGDAGFALVERLRALHPAAKAVVVSRYRPVRAEALTEELRRKPTPTV